MEISFSSNAPKKADSITLAGLKKAVKNGDKITGATRQWAVVKIFMAGPTNYYTAHSYELEEYLHNSGVDC